MVDGVNKWGVGEKLPVDLPAPAASFFGDVEDFEDNLPLLAIGGFGQGNDQMVPLHMAMVASTVANGGQMMKPYVIDATARPRRRRARQDPAVGVEEPDPAVHRRRPDHADDRRGQQRHRPAMQLANGIQAAAKTGTAQLNGPGEPEQSNAWIIGFAPAENPKYAIAVMLVVDPNDEISASTGGRLAGPIAKTVLDYMFANDIPTPSAP